MASLARWLLSQPQSQGFVDQFTWDTPLIRDTILKLQAVTSQQCIRDIPDMPGLDRHASWHVGEIEFSSFGFFGFPGRDGMGCRERASLSDEARTLLPSLILPRHIHRRSLFYACY